MAETQKFISFKEETSPSKFIALLGVLFMIFEAITFFYASDPETIFILYGILEIVFAAVIFLSLDLIGIRKIKIPYLWWLLLIFGVILVIFDALAANSDGGFGWEWLYFPAILILLAGLIEFLHKKKQWKAYLIFTLLGAAFAIYDCILVFMFAADEDLLPVYGLDDGVVFTYGFFGLIAVIVLLLTIQKWFDIKIPFTWWGLLTVGFIIFMWVSPFAFIKGLEEELAVAGNGGIILLIAFVLHLKDY